MFRLTRSSKFPRCWVIVSPGCSEKNTVPPVTREVTEDPYVNWCPTCLSCVRFVPCCHCLCIPSFVPCHWNAGLLRLFGLKEYGLGTQSLGRWIEHCSRLELHRLIIRTWHTAWRPEQQQQLNFQWWKIRLDPDLKSKNREQKFPSPIQTNPSSEATRKNTPKNPRN